MDQNLPKQLREFIEEHLTEEEKRQIIEQIYGKSLRNRQVLWTGMAREDAQLWADKHKLQTLTTAMGPLMDTDSPHCPKRDKGKREWTKYVLGASAIFAWYISKGDLVTVLTHPPPDLFHPSGKTSYQVIEEPILKGMLGNHPVGRIELVHPSVPNAPVQRYQIWPRDESSCWKSDSRAKVPNTKWRNVKLSGPPRGFEVVCGLGSSLKAPARKVDKPKTAELCPEKRNEQLTDSERHQLKLLEGEHSRARKLLQQQQGHAWKQLLSKQSEEERSTQERHCKQMSDVSMKRKKEKKREGVRQAHKNEMRHLHKNHEKLRVELKSNHDSKWKKLEKSQAEKRLSLLQKQAQDRRKLPEKHAKKNSHPARPRPRQRRQTKEKKTSQSAGIAITTKLKETKDATGILKKKEQEGTPHAGQGRFGATNHGQTVLLLLLGAGWKYFVESLMYLTQYSPSS